jgi:aminopeptidase
MSDPRIDKLAQILVQYSVAVKPGQLVGIGGAPSSPQALPLMDAVLREVCRAGAYPIPYLQVASTEGFDRTFYG